MQLAGYLLIAIFLILLTIFLKNYIWNRRILYYYSLRFKGALGLPLLGSIHKFLGSTSSHEVIGKLSKEYGDIYKFWFIEKLFIISSRPRDVEVVLKTNLEKNSVTYDALTIVAGNSLLSTSELARWKSHRKIVAPTMNKNKISSFVEIFGNETEKIVGKLSKNCGDGFFNMQYALHTATMNFVLSTLMDWSFESEEFVIQFAGYVNTMTKIAVLKAVITRLCKFLWRFIPFSKEFDMKVEAYRDVVRQIIRDRENQENSKGFSGNLVNHIIEATKNDKNWNLEDRTDLCQNMVSAALHTTATSLGLVFTALAVHQDIQEKVLEEQLRIFENSNRNPTQEDLDQMVYLESVINETLRLFPTVPAISRTIKRNLELDDNYILPDGCHFVGHIIGIHRNPKFWPEPLKFDPDRFLPEVAFKRPPGTFLPFGLGPRNCIGMNYAMTSIKVVVSKMVRRFKMTSPLKSLIDLNVSFDITLSTNGDCQISLQERDLNGEQIKNKS